MEWILPSTMATSAAYVSVAVTTVPFLMSASKDIWTLSYQLPAARGQPKQQQDQERHEGEGGGHDYFVNNLRESVKSAFIRVSIGLDLAPASSQAPAANSPSIESLILCYAREISSLSLREDQVIHAH